MTTWKEMEYEGYDCFLFEIATKAQSIEKFLDVIFNFLKRRTDFFCVMNSPDESCGFPKGKAKAILNGLYKKYALTNNSRRVNHASLSDMSCTALPHIAPCVHIERDANMATEHPDGSGNLAEKQPICTIKNTTQHNTTLQQDVMSRNARTMQTQERSRCDDDKRISTWNGGKTRQFWWNQTLTDLCLDINFSPKVLSKSEVSVTVTSTTLAVLIRSSDTRNEDSCWIPFIATQPLSESVLALDTIWCIEDGTRLVITLYKCRDGWWASPFKNGDTIDLSTVESVYQFNDLDSALQMSVEKVILDHQRGHSPPQDSKEPKLTQILEKAWNAENSPFKGVPFNPNALNLSTTCGQPLRSIQ